MTKNDKKVKILTEKLEKESGKKVVLQEQKENNTFNFFDEIKKFRYRVSVLDVEWESLLNTLGIELGERQVQSDTYGLDYTELFRVNKEQTVAFYYYSQRNRRIPKKIVGFQDKKLAMEYKKLVEESLYRETFQK